MHCIQDWDLSLRDEIGAEALRYGTLVHIRVLRDSAGHVHLMYADVGNAIAAATAFNGRAFAARTIGVEFVPLPLYVSTYPDVAALV